MTIIEKLGIKPIERKYNKTIWDTIFSQEEVREVEQQRNEMLIWIIGMMQCANSGNLERAAKLLSLGDEVIEKASGKTFEEIKELLK